MKISIITTSYNYEEYIKETIESVLAQTYTNWEMIIVDDGSKDNSINTIKEYCEKDKRIKLYQHENGENKGIVESVKLGVEKSTTDWIVFLESDDTICPEYLETKIEVIKKHPDIKFIFNDVNMFGDKERIKEYQKHFIISKGILSQYSYPTNLLKHFIGINLVPTFSVVMLKREILEDIDYNVKFKPILDWYLWAQLAVDNKFYYIDKKLTNWRMHTNSYILTKATPKQELNWQLQIKNVVFSKDFNIFASIFYSFRIYRRYFLRIHFKKMKFCFMGNWYDFPLKNMLEKYLTFLQKKERIIQNSQIKFSIIMPTYNRAFCITNAIDSLINQTYQNYELIIVDDGSTDNTEALLKETYSQYFDKGQFIYTMQNHLGVSQTRNTGINLAKNDWIAYLDTDNEIVPTFLEEFVYAISTHKSSCYYAQIEHPKIGIIGKPFNYKKLCKANFIDLGVFVHKKSLIEKYGNFDTNLKRLVDWDLILRFTEKEKPFFIKKVLLNYNDNDDFARITNTESLDAAMNIIKKKQAKK